MSHPTPGLDALLGRVEVRVGRCAASFQMREGRSNVSGGGRRPTRVEVAAPGCVIGRGDKADLQVTGPDSRDVSRRHLLLQPSGRQWTVTDVGSHNHTFELDPASGDWRRVGPDRPLPVEPGMLLNLGGQLILRFDLIRERAGGTTTGSADGGPAGGRRVRPPALEELAEALLSRRRTDPLDRMPPSTAELLERVHCERATLFRRQAELNRLPEISAFAPAGRGELCDALARAFPYLLAPRLEERAP